MRNKAVNNHKCKCNKHNHHDELVNEAMQQSIQLAFEQGRHDGFVHCLTIMMYAVMETTNYRQNGLLKIWNRALDITDALAREDVELTETDIQLALAAEGGIVSDELSQEQARAALKRTNGKPNKEYKQVVQDAMVKYKTMRDAQQK